MYVILFLKVFCFKLIRKEEMLKIFIVIERMDKGQNLMLIQYFTYI